MKEYSEWRVKGRHVRGEVVCKFRTKLIYKKNNLKKKYKKKVKKKLKNNIVGSL